MPSLPQQFLAGFGELRAMPAAVEELHLQVLLQLLDGVSNGRGYAVQFLACCGKAAVTGDGIEDQQGVE